jgi:hypothetical protein
MSLTDNADCLLGALVAGGLRGWRRGHLRIILVAFKEEEWGHILANKNLGDARKAKNDEFYTQYADIQKEMNAYLEYNPEIFKGRTILLPCDDPEWSNFTKYFAQNFETLGLKKLISTSYAPNSKPKDVPYQPALFELEDEKYDETKTQSNGKIFTLTKDVSGDNRIDVDDLEWSYLDGDGDFRSEEVTKLRDEADFIITNPPFSLFREFLGWVFEAKKLLSIVGSLNAITYKEVFPYIKENKLWLGNGFQAGNAYFASPLEEEYAAGVYDATTGLVKFRNVNWYTNIEHGKRHQPLPLMTMAENIKFSKHKEVKGLEYGAYVNFDAIEVPFTDSIPSDYEGMMGVPISFMNKYSPDQFEILGSSDELARPMSQIAEKGSFQQGGPRFYLESNEGKFRRIYTRLVIRHRRAK